MNNKELGQQIRQARKNAGLTQEALAQVTGIKRTAMNKIENGGRAASALELIAIAKAINLDIDALVGAHVFEEVAGPEAFSYCKLIGHSSSICVLIPEAGQWQVLTSRGLELWPEQQLKDWQKCGTGEREHLKVCRQSLKDSFGDYGKETDLKFVEIMEQLEARLELVAMMD